MTEVNNAGGSAQVLYLRQAPPTESKAKPEAPPPETKAAAAEAKPNAVEQFRKERDEVQAKREALDARDPLEKAAEKLEEILPKNEFLPNTRLVIDKDDESGRFVYQNVDKDSGEVVKQFPPEQLLEFLSYYREVEGLAVDDKA